MKRIWIMVLVLALCLSLCACKSEEAKNVEALITAIGEVTADSEAAISAARDAYSALTEEDKASVENAAALATAEAAYADILIDAIGEVSVDSEAAITEAEAYLAALDADAAAQVTKGADLTAAQEAYAVAVEEARIEAIRQSIIGVWVNEAVGSKDMAEEYLPEGTYGDHRDLPSAILSNTEWKKNYGDKYLDFKENGEIVNSSGTLHAYWELSEDGTSVVIIPRTGVEANHEVEPLQIIEEGGFMKLYGGGIATLDSLEEIKVVPFAMVKQEDYQAAFADKYVAVELTDENYREYLGDPVNIGEIIDAETGDITYGYVHESPAYDNGLIYLADTVNFYMEFDYQGSHYDFYTSLDMVSTYLEDMENFVISKQVSGTIYYIKAEYVAENYVDENGMRTVVMTNGTTLTFDIDNSTWSTFWNRTEADYNDYIY